MIIERETAERKNGLAASQGVKQSPYELAETLRRLLFFIAQAVQKSQKLR